MEDKIVYLHEQNSSKKPKIFSVDGNIGSGKSTLVNELKNYYTNNKKICFLQEPVSIWENIKDKNGTNILVNYYNNQQKYAFTFQMMAYISRLSLLKNAVESNLYDIIITERSVETDKMIFAKMLYDMNIIEEIEYTIYNMWFTEFIKDLPKFKYIYVQTTPEISNERIIKRNRLGENIDIKYLEKCHNYHENWLNKNDKNILIIDGCTDCTIDKEITKKWIQTIDNFINL